MGRVGGGRRGGYVRARGSGGDAERGVRRVMAARRRRQSCQKWVKVGHGLPAQLRNSCARVTPKTQKGGELPLGDPVLRSLPIMTPPVALPPPLT